MSRGPLPGPLAAVSAKSRRVRGNRARAAHPRPSWVGPHPPPSSIDATGHKTRGTATTSVPTSRISGAGSEDGRLAPHAPRLAQRVAHLAHRRVRARRLEDRRHQVRVRRRLRPQPPERRLDRGLARAASRTARTRSIWLRSRAGSILSSGRLLVAPRRRSGSRRRRRARPARPRAGSGRPRRRSPRWKKFCSIPGDHAAELLDPRK